MPEAVRPLHVVITIHGIRTYGRWQRRLEELLTADARWQDSQIDKEVLHYRYGVFTLLSFVIPFLRNLAVKQFHDYLESSLELRQYSRVDIVAHSFGTYLAVEALAGTKLTDKVRINTLILCGSAVSPNRSLGRLVGPGRRINRLVNDCGTRDGVLLLTLPIFGVGMAGRLGFQGLEGPTFRQRYHSLGHSGYFELANRKPYDGFMRRWWLPLLLDEAPPKLRDRRPQFPPLSDRIWRFLGENGSTFAVSLYSAVLGGLAVAFWALWSTAAMERDRAESTLAATTSSVNDLVREVAVGMRQTAGVPTQLTRDVLKRVTDVQTELAKFNPNDRNLLRSQATAYRAVSRVLELQSDYKGALKYALAAENFISDLLVAEPDDTQLNREMAATYSTIGEALSRNEGRRDAISYFNRSLSIRLRIANYELEEQRELALSYERLGDEYSLTGETSEARDAFEACFKIRKALALDYPGRPQQESDLAVILTRIAKMDSESSPDQAIKSYDDSLTIWRNLIVQNARNSEWRRALAANLDELGDLLTLLNRSSEALPYYQESLKVREELARVNPELSLWQGLTALSLFKLAGIGQRTEEYYRRALEILRELERRDEMPSSLRGLPIEIEARLQLTFKNPRP